VFAVLFAVSLGTYLITFLGGQVCRRKQNLRTKYDAKWALVTGARSVASSRRAWEWARAVSVCAPRLLLYSIEIGAHAV
jgi:hypothetical protein